MPNRDLGSVDYKFPIVIDANYSTCFLKQDPKNDSGRFDQRSGTKSPPLPGRMPACHT